jgi:probable F420-dependent oxidoreductase
MKPFEFLAESRDPISARELGERARRAEALGYHALVIPDHILDQLSPVPSMAVIAAATERLRIGAFVFNNDLRHPAVLAQDLASLDVLSEGRLDVAIGAGWNQPEYASVGIAFERPAIRSERLAEAVAVLKGCFADGPFSFDGRYYRITEYDAGPAPVQRPHPPFLIGGGGRRTLSLAAREAQIVGLAPRIGPSSGRDPGSLTWAATEEKIGWVREAARDRFDELRLNVYPSGVPVTIVEDARAEARRVADELAASTGVRLTEDEVLESPQMFIGSLDRLEEKFMAMRERLGISSIMVGELGPLDRLVERLAGR